MSSFMPPTEPQAKREFNRPKYLRFKEGTPVIVRILDSTAHLTIKHWIPRAEVGVLCLRDRCPICESNAKIRAEHPSDFKKIKGYIPQQFRYMVNVFDRTPVILDPETGEEYYSYKGVFPSVSNDGKRSLAGIQPAPSNTVKVLERGKQLFEQVAVLHDDAQQEHAMSITDFDVKLTTLGSGQSMIITPVPMHGNKDVIDLDSMGLSVYALSTLGIQLTPDEMIKILNGVSLRDIYAARRASEETEVESRIEGSLADVSEAVLSIFNDAETLDDEEEENG